MSLTKEALQYVADLALEGRNIHEAKDIVYRALKNPDGSSHIEEYARDPVPRNHKFEALDGFLNYLKSDHCKDEGVIFVSPDLIFADLEYGEYGQQNISLALTHSEEYNAFLSICHVDGDNYFMPQKEIWRKLISSLADTIDPAFLLQVQGIGLGQSNKAKFEIDNSGITSTKVAQKVSITVSQENKESKTAPFLIDWEWKGRIWECFNKEYNISFRVEVETDDSGIGFICHPKRKQTVLRRAREDIVDNLIKVVPKQFKVYEGQY